MVAGQKRSDGGIAAVRATRRSGLTNSVRVSTPNPLVTQGDRFVTSQIWSLSKKAANYRPAPRPEVRCQVCKFMFPPLAIGGCRLVRGLIRAADTCDRFTPRHTSG